MNHLLKNLSIDALTPMQEDACAAIGTGHDVVLLAPTGSGKTLAYLLPLAVRQPAIPFLVICPTRELAQQSCAVWKQMRTGIPAMSLHGGRPAMDEHRLLRAIQPRALFATPGRFNDHLDKGNINPSALQTIVIDEFDKCLELGFQEAMQRILERLPGLNQTVLLSATDAAAIPDFMPEGAAHAVRLDFLSGTAELRARVKNKYVRSPERDKLVTLSTTLAEVLRPSANTPAPQAIVFVSHRESAERVGEWLSRQGYVGEVYHGGMEQELRERALFKFRAGSANILIATDLAARGLDIPDVAAVIHYHLPLREEDYVHRSGRTARWNRTGDNYFILGPTEVMPRFVPGEQKEIVLDTDLLSGKASQKPPLPAWTSVYIGRGRKQKLSRGDVVGFFCKQGGLRAADIGRIDIHDHHAYAALRTSCAAEALRQVAGEKIKGMKTIVEKMRR
ncbi:MAG: DEAD/DEAH box helicase [Alloprevotella sp.]|nr:DEAD/DEAH box helicase [Alloprevotella sp.]